MTEELSKLAMARALAASRMQKAWIEGDREAALQAIAEIHAPGLRALLVQGGESVRRAMCTSLEVTTTALLQWWFSDGDDQSWRVLLVPDADGHLPLPELASNAAMLRLCNSEVVSAPGTPIDPASFAHASPARQARALAHVCLTTDAGAELDYAKLYAATTPELRPFLATWCAATYLTSPDHRFDEQATARQTAARAAFTAVHATETHALPPNIGLTSVAYRAALDEPDVRPFLETLDARALRPAIDVAASLEKTDGVGVLLEGCGAGGKLDRRAGRTLELLRRRGARGVVVADDVEQAWSSLPEPWQSPETDVVGMPAASSLDGLALSARALAEESLDMLVYPQVSLGVASRWLSSQRLARVQVNLASELTTSGSAAMDYCIVGEDLVGDGSEFSEDVLVIPGLGLDITVPATPTVTRQRADDERECLLVSTVTGEKLSGPLLDLWNSILERAGNRAALHFFPAISETQASRLESSLTPHFVPGVDALMVPTVTPEVVTETLVEADLFLDSFPFGGLHAMVNALHTGCPAITIEGDHARNRAGAQILRRLDLPEFLIAKNGGEYVEAAMRLIDNPSLRAELRSRLTAERVRAALVDPDLPNHVVAALELAQHLGPRIAGRRSAPRRVFDSTGGQRLVG